jgi:hypothetical protein
VKIRQPVLEIEDVSRVIVEHILRGDSGQVFIPDHINGAGILRALPNWVQEYIRNFISSDLRKIRLAQHAREADEGKT